MTRPTQTIFICAEERSGSEWLCDMMTNTGVLGRPQEYFNRDGMRILSGQIGYPDDLPAQIEYAHELGVTRNGVFSVKLPSWHFQDLWKENWHVNFPNPKFVRLTRKDHLRQAISLARARQTQVWHHDHQPIAKEDYNYELIKQLLVECSTNRSRWDLFFACMGVEPRHITYEDLLKYHRAKLLDIASCVGETKSVPDTLPKTERRIQRDMLTERWRQMFLRDYREETGYA